MIIYQVFVFMRIEIKLFPSVLDYLLNDFLVDIFVRLES